MAGARPRGAENPLVRRRLGRQTIPPTEVQYNTPILQHSVGILSMLVHSGCCTASVDRNDPSVYYRFRLGTRNCGTFPGEAAPTEPRRCRGEKRGEVTTGRQGRMAPFHRLNVFIVPPIPDPGLGVDGGAVV